MKGMVWLVLAMAVVFPACGKKNGAAPPQAQLPPLDNPRERIAPFVGYWGSGERGERQFLWIDQRDLASESGSGSVEIANVVDGLDFSPITSDPEPLVTHTFKDAPNARTVGTYSYPTLRSPTRLALTVEFQLVRADEKKKSDELIVTVREPSPGRGSQTVYRRIDDEEQGRALFLGFKATRSRAVVDAISDPKRPEDCRLERNRWGAPSVTSALRYIARGNFTCVRVYVEQGGAVNPSGVSLLDAAVGRGHAGMVEYLIGHGALLNPKPSSSPLDRALSDLLRPILVRGSVDDGVWVDGNFEMPRIRDLLVRNGADLKTRRADGTNDFQRALSRSNEPQLISLMLSKGADPSILGPKGSTFLHEFLRDFRARWGTHGPELLAALLKGGANPQEIDPAMGGTDLVGRVIDEAAGPEALDLLVSSGIDVRTARLRGFQDASLRYCTDAMKSRQAYLRLTPAAIPDARRVQDEIARLEAMIKFLTGL